MVKSTEYDAAQHLDSTEDIAAYLTEAFQTNDEALIAIAIGTVARAKGIAAVAEKAGLSRETLYCALGGHARPEFAIVMKVLHALEINLVAQPARREAT
jgi:probable addiction module antidote protein